MGSVGGGIINFQFLFINCFGAPATKPTPPQFFRSYFVAVIAAIKAAGGYSVLAHPFRLDDEQMVHDIVDMGVQGLEAHYISHNDEMVSKYLQIAREKDLLVTGGSDFHWPTKNKKLGDFYCKEVSTTILAHSELE